MKLITLNKEEVSLCRKASENMWCNKKSGNYGKGILNTKEDPYKVTRMGLLGEYAFAKWAGLKTNFDYVDGGVPHDFKCSGYNIDIKTSLLRSKRATWYIMCMNENGKKIPPISDYYVFTHLRVDELDSAEIMIYGFLPVEKVLEQPIVQGRGKHFNFEIYQENLLPINDLLEHIILRNID